MKSCSKRMLKILSGIILLVLLTVTHVMALHPETHRAINESLASEGFLDGYLKEQMGLQEGIKTKYNERQLFKLVGDGGAKEDSGTRCFNHFHNPLTNKGLAIGQSTLLWATLPLEQQKLAPLSSWDDVRYYYYRALTDADISDRNNWFALMFQGLGQLMHLVEDMSVPAHTRDDSHPPPFWNEGYEVWARESINDMSNVSTYLGYDGIFSYTPYDNSLFLIPQLFDTDQYKGGNPEITTTSSSIGLAEYTNANFFSDDTINASNFPHPQIDSNNRHIKPHEGPSGTYKREYFVKNCSGGYCEPNATKSYQGYLLSAVDLNDYWRQKNPNAAKPKPVIPILDENVYADYAQLLIRRAVGYSGEVLKYFFRADMNMRAASQGYSGYVIENNTREAMEGEFHLYYDNTSDERVEIKSGSFPITAMKIEANSTGGNVNFAAPTDARKPGEYMLVFRGNMGGETGAVACRFIRTQSHFIFSLTRGDGIPVTPALNASFNVTDSSGNRVSYTVTYIGDAESTTVPGKWKVTLTAPPANADPKGYWVYYSCDDSLGAQYPHKYKMAEHNKAENLIQPGTYTDTIPYYKEISSGWSPRNPRNAGIGPCRKTFQIICSVSFNVMYSLSSSLILSDPQGPMTYAITSSDGALNLSGGNYFGPYSTAWIPQEAGSHTYVINITTSVDPWFALDRFALEMAPDIRVYSDMGQGL